MSEQPFAPKASSSACTSFLGATLGAAMWGSLAAALLLAFEDGVSLAGLVLAVVFFILALMASIFVVPVVALLVGLPFSFLLAKLRRESAATYTIGGAVLGLLPLAAGGWSDPTHGLVMLSFAVYGGACGRLWWLLERQFRQPGPEH